MREASLVLLPCAASVFIDEILPSDLLPLWFAAPRFVVPPIADSIESARRAILCGTLPELADLQPQMSHYRVLELPEGTPCLYEGASPTQAFADAQDLIAEVASEGLPFALAACAGFDADTGEVVLGRSDPENLPPFFIFDPLNLQRFVEIKRYFGALELHWLLQRVTDGAVNFSVLCDAKEGLAGAARRGDIRRD